MRYISWHVLPVPCHTPRRSSLGTFAYLQRVVLILALLCLRDGLLVAHEFWASPSLLHTGVAHAGQSTLAPFATVDAESFQKDFHPTQRKKDGAAKVRVLRAFCSTTPAKRLIFA